MTFKTLTGFYARAVRQRLYFLTWQKLILLSVLFCAYSGYAQAPTSLQYPASNSFATQTDYVYLAPTLSGTATSYSISPALPAGISINTTTGIISGVGTASSPATNYTVTATNASGSATATVNIGVTNTFYDNGLSGISFLDASRTFKIGNGQTAGDIALYTGVTTIGSQVIDCIVTTVVVNNVSSWTAHDQSALSGTYFSNNQDKYFSPQVTFGANGGSILFEFQFILGGSYNNVTNTGTNVTLQNVYVNTYDIDGNGAALSNQFNEFEGFAKSEIAPTTNIMAPVYDAVSGLSKFASTTDQNNATVTDDIGRIRLTYDRLSKFRVNVGSGATGLAFFFLDLSIGITTFTGAVVTNNIALDLNTTTVGLDNADLVSSTAVNFARTGTTNITSSTALNALAISYDNTAANLPDGASETMKINGTAGTYNHALNFTTGSTSSVTVGGVAYTITKTTNGSINTLTFTNGGTFTLAQAEALIDAIQYLNTDPTPTNGERQFSVRVNNTMAASPVAQYVPNLNAITIAGNIYHDANGLTDNTVNGNGTMGQFAANGAYAVLTDASNNVLSTVGIAAGGGYSFGRREAGNYNVYISGSATPGATFSASTFPAGNYKSTGENLGAAAGNDGSINSKMVLTVGNLAVANANIGIEIPPAATDFTSGNIANPGGYNFYTLPTPNFNTTDADGTVQSITITSFPTGANYLKVGGTTYTNGGTCPPQAACTAWPATLVVPIANINTISIDPTAAGNTSVTLQYTTVDNGALRSNNNVPTSVTIPFTVPATPISVTGNVWNDADGDGVKATGEVYSAAANAGQTLYAVLVQNTNTYSGAATILASGTVTAGATGYTFSNVPAGNGYEVRIVSLATAPVDGAARTTISPALATGYMGVSTSNAGTATANLNTISLINSLGVVAADKTAINFGIERAPDTAPFTTTIAKPAVNGFATLNGGTNPPVFSGTDAEDQPTQASLSGKTVAITQLPANGQLWYNGTQIVKGDDNLTVPSGSNPRRLTAFDATKMQIKFTGGGYTAVSFTYAYIDAAGLIDGAPATYAVNWLIALPVKLVSFTGTPTGCTVNLSWKTAEEKSIARYEVEYSHDAARFYTLGSMAGKAAEFGSEYTFTTTPESGKGYFRLKMIGTDGSATYSNNLAIATTCANRAITFAPNPATNLVQVTGLANGDNLRLYSADGRLVSSKTNTGPTNDVAVQNLPKGTYTLLVYDAANHPVYTGRIIKQ